MKGELSFREHDVVAMAVGDQSMTESGSSEGDRTSTCVLNPGTAAACETSMWEEWTQATSTGGDEVSTSNFLPELTSCTTTSRLSFQQSDMLANWMSSFHPLTQSSPDLTPTSVDSFLHEPAGLALDHPSDLDVDHVFPNEKAHRHLRRALGPLSPSSPLAIQNGLLNPLGDPWDSSSSTLQWSTAVTTTDQTYNNYGRSIPSFIPDHSSTAIEHLENMITSSRYNAIPISPRLSRPRHTDMFIGPNGTFESSTPGGWTPQLMSETTTVGTSPMKLMATLREATSCSDVCAESKLNGEIGLIRERTRSPVSPGQGGSAVPMSSILAECKRSGGAESSMSTQVVWPGKHRLELVELVDGEDDVKTTSPPMVKRPKITSVRSHHHFNIIPPDATFEFLPYFCLQFYFATCTHYQKLVLFWTLFLTIF